MAGLNIFFINLDRRVDRKTALLNQFAQHIDRSININRVAAIDSASKTMPATNQSSTADAISLTEKACYQSHLKAIEMASHTAEHSLILEDDVCFSERTQATLESIINLPQFDKIDICFAELGLESMAQYPALYAIKHNLAQRGKVSLLDLDGYRFHGATAYIVNRRSKGKLLKLIRSNSNLSQPYDEDIAQWIREGKLNARCIFPFPITLSPIDFRSDIRNDENHFYTHVRLRVRRLLGVDFDHTQPIEIGLDSYFHNNFNSQHDHFMKLMSLAYSREFDDFLRNSLT